MRIDDIIIEHHQHGQARRYADSVYEAYISVRIVGDLIGTAVHYLNLQEATVKDIARNWVRPFKDKPSSPFAATLTVCEPVGPTELMRKEVHPKHPCTQESRWYVKIVEAFTD